MDIVQASFQASFDSRVEQLSDVDLADLRVIFRYFDTDGDGAVSASQACRMFALLGLDVNTAQVRELGEVYLNEFMKIVDSHVQAPPSQVSEAEVENTTSVEGEVAIQSPEQSVGETERNMRNEKVLEDEWKLLDTYRRGRVSMQELRLFLSSCQSTLSLDDTVRLLETYGNTIEIDEVEELEFTKEGFLKFRHEYTPKKMASSDDDLSSDDDDENGLMGDVGMVEQRVLGTSSSEMNQPGNGAASMRAQSRHAERGPSDNSNDHFISSMEHELVVNPDELVESDESDEEVTRGNHATLLHGHDSTRS